MQLYVMRLMHNLCMKLNDYQSENGAVDQGSHLHCYLWEKYDW